MNWIKCTETTANVVTYINMDQVVKMHRLSGEQATRLYTTENLEGQNKKALILVKETPEQVMQLLMKAGNGAAA